MDEPLKETPLKEEHIKIGAKMVPFAGWLMPVQYTSVTAEHEAVRKRAGLFDVSHMGQFLVEGPGATEALNILLPVDVAKIKPLAVKYSMLLDENGGVIDDLLVYRREEPESFLIVANASNIEPDDRWMGRHLETVTFKNISAERGMLALQGPRAEKVLQPLVSIDLSTLKYYHFAEDVALAGTRCVVSRTGYTGEDGFEIMIPIKETVKVWRAVLESPAARAEGLLPAGLGARDILRLEAGMPLHGHELSEAVGPIEAGLEKVIAWDKKDFIGLKALKEKKKNQNGSASHLIGLVMEGRAPARAEYPVLDADGECAGSVTSGSPSPTVGAPIAIALVKDAAKRPLAVEIRGKTYPAKEIKLPFYSRRRS